jgi:tetratricopeptide (TPR) repeat protein
MSQRKDQLLLEAVVAHRNGNIKNAVKLYKSIISEEPSNPDAHHNLGLIALEENRKSEALRLFKAALRINKDVDQFWLSYIRALIEAKKFRQAAAAIESAKSYVTPQKALLALTDRLELVSGTSQHKNLTPSKSEINTLVEHIQKGRLNKAHKLANAITNDFPLFASGWKLHSAILWEKGNLTGAVLALRKYINLSPADKEAINDLGVLLFENGQLEEAEQAYKKSLHLNPNNENALSNLGIIQKGTGRLKEAELSYRKALMVSPRFANAHNNLGNVLRELERPEEAKESFLQAISCDATYIDAHFNLGVLLHEYGDFDGSEKSLRNAIKLEDNHAEAHSSLGNTLKELGKLGEAEASYTKAIALRPGHTDALQNRGLLYLEKKDYAAALEDFNESNSEASSAYALAALYALGRTEDICRRLKSRQKEDKYNLRVAAFSSFFSNVSKKETANEFCSNPLDLLYFSNISAHLGESESFSEGVIQELRGIENIWEPNSRTTNKGFQSKAHVNIFESEATQIKRLESIVTSELDSFYSKFKILLVPL